MIIDSTYFKNELYIPHAAPSVSDAVTGVQEKVNEFIADYARDCLIKSLGFQLATELIAVLDPTQANGLNVGADAKWNDLLNGKSYTDPTTDLAVAWRGIRFKSISTGEYNRSFLANYVYFFYEENDHITRSDVGHVIETPKNAEVVTPTNKVVKAWNKFVVQVQGKETRSEILNKQWYWNQNGSQNCGMLGLDYYQGGGEEVSLYKFINDSNDLVADTYENFTPKTWAKINQFGI